MATSQPTTPRPSPLLILLHGGALSSQMYCTTIPFLSTQSFSLLTPDLPGHGPNASTAGPFSFPASYTLLTDLIRTARSTKPSQNIVLVGVSLGGQVVLDYMQRQQQAATTNGLSSNPSDSEISSRIDAAIVASAPIQPPSDDCPWEMPRLPSSSPSSSEEDQEWTRIITADITHLGPPSSIQAIQTASFAFRFEPSTPSSHDSGPPPLLPPTLLLTGEHDVAMANRDVEVIVERIGKVNGERGVGRVERRVLSGAWHNHPIDVPELFAGVVGKWVREVCG